MDQDNKEDGVYHAQTFTGFFYQKKNQGEKHHGGNFRIVPDHYPYDNKRGIENRSGDKESDKTIAQLPADKNVH